MTLSRKITLLIHFVLDECVPPVIRDSKWFMWLPFKLLFRDKADVFFEFKERAPTMTALEFANAYKDTADVHIARETDLNTECIHRILASIVGSKVLDVGCGRGYLCNRIQEHGFETTGVDIHIAEKMVKRYPNVRFEAASSETLPFGDDGFDTVVCSHTLEHVQNLDLAIAELRRVARQRVIIVVPRQRNYRYTFDLHLRFFTYPHDLLAALGPSKGQQICEVIGGDLYAQEDAPPAVVAGVANAD